MAPSIFATLGKAKILPERFTGNLPRQEIVKTNISHKCGGNLHTVRTRYFLKRDGTVIYAKAGQSYLLVIYCPCCGYNTLLY